HKDVRLHFPKTFARVACTEGALCPRFPAGSVADAVGLDAAPYLGWLTGQRRRGAGGVPLFPVPLALPVPPPLLPPLPPPPPPPPPASPPVIGTQLARRGEQLEKSKSGRCKSLRHIQGLPKNGHENSRCPLRL